MPNPTAPFDFDDLLISATRYYMGRMTIATTAHARKVAEAWPHLPKHVQTCIQRDLKREFERDDRAREQKGTNRAGGLPLGMDCDREAWEEVRQAWRRHD